MIPAKPPKSSPRSQKGDARDHFPFSRTVTYERFIRCWRLRPVTSPLFPIEARPLAKPFDLAFSKQTLAVQSRSRKRFSVFLYQIADLAEV